MKRLTINFLVFIALASFSSCGYNSMVEKDERIKGAWSQVQNVYQRRADLIPQIARAVEASGKFEKSTLTGIVQARAQATSVQVNIDSLTPEKMKQYQKVQDNLTTQANTFSRLLAVNENYPVLQTNRQFSDMMAELAGSENRIAVERRRFNEAVEDYNSYIRKFPNNMTAGMFGFERKDLYFTAQEGAEKPADWSIDIK